MNLRSGALVLLIALALAACGGAPPAGPTAAPTSAAATGTPAAMPTGEPTEPPTAEPPPSAPASFEPGAVRYRVANLTDQPVDVYVRTQGLVQSWLVHPSLGLGEVTDYIAPPEPGSLMLMTAGATDPDCVGTCPDIIGSWGTTNASGDQMTIFLHPGGAADLWENPDPDDIGSYANALPPAPAGQSLLLPIARELEGADFGLRIGFAGEPGCATDITESNLLVGGTSVLPFAFDGSGEVLVYDSSDTDCSGEPVGGPFEVDAADAARTLLLLYGSTDEMDALVLPIP